MNPDPVFNLSPIVNINGTVTIIGDPGDGDLLTIAGTALNDNITVTSTQITVAGAPALNYTAANLAGLRINGLEGDDKVDRRQHHRPRDRSDHVRRRHGEQLADADQGGTAPSATPTRRAPAPGRGSARWSLPAARRPSTS